jgi:polyphosphate kinase
MPLVDKFRWRLCLHHVLYRVWCVCLMKSAKVVINTFCCRLLFMSISRSCFSGMVATGCYQFRVTRNADLTVDEDVDDLALALKGGLFSRRFGKAVRLEVADTCPKTISDYLLRQFGLKEQSLYRVNGPVNLARLLSNFNRPRLRYAPFTPSIPSILQKSESVFDALKKQDVLLHHPFESFTPVINFLREAARDPQVLAIKQTLYRTGADSEIVKILADAARHGKEVTAVIELRARFDEESNIEVANKLQEAGRNCCLWDCRLQDSR